MGFNPQKRYSVDKNLKHAYDYVASLVRRTQPPFAKNVQYLRNLLSNIWKALLGELGRDGPKFRQISHISLKILCQTTLMDSGKIDHLDKRVGRLHVEDDKPLGFSQKYETQQQPPEGVLKKCFV